MSNDLLDEMIGIVSFIHDIEEPTSKEDRVKLYNDYLLRANGTMEEVISMVSEGAHISEQCDRRINDTIIYLLAAKKSIG